MRRGLMSLALALFATAARAAELLPVEENGPRSQRVNLVFLAEGYTAAESGKFADDVATVVAAVFAREPWREYRAYCNIYGIMEASAESGCDHGETSGPNGVRNTAFGTSFTDPAVPQWIQASQAGLDSAFTVVNSLVPEFDCLVILVNDAKYGGSGGGVIVVTMHPLGASVVEHELGHTFAQLADEYEDVLPGFVPYEAPNCTAATQFAQIRWRHWIEAGTPLPTPETAAYGGTVGLFEGACYTPSGWFRPHYDSLMRHLDQPCGAVNREQFVLRYYQYAAPLDSYAPAATMRTVSGMQPLFFETAPLPQVGVTWSIDGLVQTSSSGNTLSVLSGDLGNGLHTITATARDATPFVRADPSNLLKQTVSWPLFLNAQPLATLDDWRAYYGDDMENPSGDGLCNLLKYALGLSPTMTANASARPTLGWISSNGAVYPALTVERQSRRADVSYTIETSDDLAEWHSGAQDVVVLEDSWTRLVARAAAPVGGGRRFMRLRVNAAQ